MSITGLPFATGVSKQLDSIRQRARHKVRGGRGGRRSRPLPIKCRERGAGREPARAGRASGLPRGRLAADSFGCREMTAGRCLAGFSLARDSGLGMGNRFRIAQIFAFDRLQVGVQLIDDGNAVGNIQADDVIV